MKRLLEALVAGSILLGSCASTQKTETPILEERVNDYHKGMMLKYTAETETDKTRKKELYNRAGNSFFTAMLKRNNTHDSMIEYADCLSQSGDIKQALEWIDKAITLQETEKAYDTKGLICAREGFLSFAEQNFTKAIEKQDTAQYRWHRFQVRLKTAQTENDYLDKALEDIRKVTEFKPEEPEGHFYVAAVYGTMMLTRQEESYAREVFNSLKKAINLIDAGNKTKLSITEINEMRTVYNSLKDHFEPARTTFEEENY